MLRYGIGLNVSLSDLWTGLNKVQTYIFIQSL